MMFHDDDVVMNIDNYSNIYNLNNTNHTNRNVYIFMKESLILFFHQILYYRSIYPIEVFISSRPECINGILCYICQHPFIIQYIDSFVHQVIEIIRNDHHHQNDQNDDNNDNDEFIDCISFIILDQRKDHPNNNHKNHHDSVDDNQHVKSQMASPSSTQSTNDASTIANSNNSNDDQQDILVPKEGYILQFLNDHSMNYTNNSTQHTRRNNNNNNNNKKKIRSLPYNNKNRDHLVSKMEKKEKEQRQHKDKHHTLWILWERSIREMILRIQRSSSSNIIPIKNNDVASKSLQLSCDNKPVSCTWSEFVTFQLHIHRKKQRSSTSFLSSVKETKSTIKNLTWNDMNSNNEWIIWNDQNDNNNDDDEEVTIVEQNDSISATRTLCPKPKSQKTSAITSIRPLDEYMTPFGTIQLMSIIY